MKKRFSEEQLINVEGTGCGVLGEGDHPPSRYSGADLLSLVVEVRRHGFQTRSSCASLSENDKRKAFGGADAGQRR